MEISSDYFKEIVLVLYIVILGMSLTASVSHFGKIIQNIEHVTSYWLHTLWGLMIIALLFQYAEHSWGFRNAINWNHLHVIAAITNPLIVYFASEVIFPDLTTKENINLKDYYYSKSKYFFRIMSVVPLYTYFSNSFILKSWNLIFLNYSSYFFRLFLFYYLFLEKN